MILKNTPKMIKEMDLQMTKLYFNQYGSSKSNRRIISTNINKEKEKMNIQDMDIINSVIATKRTKDNVRLMIPVLIHWAKTGQYRRTYGDLTHAIGKTKFSGIGHSLYAVQEVLNKLSEETEKEIPTLNSLCKNSKSMLPAEGFEYVSKNYNDMEDKAKKIFIEDLDSKAISYKYWDWVLEKLNLKPYKILTTEELDTIKNPHTTSCEGEEHKKLKEYISKHPEALGYKDVVSVETEYILPSGDRLDVYIELPDATHIAVEVKPKDAPENDILRGIFQCIKYAAIMEAMRNLESQDYEIETLLVTTGHLSDMNKKIAEELNIEYVEDLNYK